MKIMFISSSQVQHLEEMDRILKEDPDLCNLLTKPGSKGRLFRVDPDPKNRR
jgi:hypothetical protein